MNTIKDEIIRIEILRTERRIEDLTKIQAPAVMLDSLKELLVGYRDGDIKIGGEVELADETYVNHEVRKGRGGVPYVSFNNGEINYFPFAKYGRAIFKASR